MTILTKNTKFDDINIGDEIPSFEIEETQETMDKPQKNQWNLDWSFKIKFISL